MEQEEWEHIVDRKFIISKIEDLLEKEYNEGRIEYFSEVYDDNRIVIDGWLDANSASFLALYLRKLEKLGN